MSSPVARSNVINLYRNMLRLAARLPSKAERTGTVAKIRAEFRSNASETDSTRWDISYIDPCVWLKLYVTPGIKGGSFPIGSLKLSSSIVCFSKILHVFLGFPLSSTRPCHPWASCACPHPSPELRTSPRPQRSKQLVVAIAAVAVVLIMYLIVRIPTGTVRIWIRIRCRGTKRSWNACDLGTIHTRRGYFNYALFYKSVYVSLIWWNVNSCIY